jgi:hypothetical protein
MIALPRTQAGFKCAAEARVNGRRIKLIVDTGADLTVLTKRRASKAGLRKRPTDAGDHRARRPQGLCRMDCKSEARRRRTNRAPWAERGDERTRSRPGGGTIGANGSGMTMKHMVEKIRVFYQDELEQLEQRTNDAVRHGAPRAWRRWPPTSPACRTHVGSTLPQSRLQSLRRGFSVYGRTHVGGDEPPSTRHTPRRGISSWIERSGRRRACGENAACCS